MSKEPFLAAAVDRECPMCGCEIASLDEHWPKQWDACRGYYAANASEVNRTLGGAIGDARPKAERDA